MAKKKKLSKAIVKKAITKSKTGNTEHIRLVILDTWKQESEDKMKQYQKDRANGLDVQEPKQIPLSLDWGTVNNFLATNPDLKQKAINLTERMDNVATLKLYQEVAKGEPWAIKAWFAAKRTTNIFLNQDNRQYNTLINSTTVSKADMFVRQAQELQLDTPRDAEIEDLDYRALAKTDKKK